MVLRRIALPGATEVVRFADKKIVVLGIECLEDCPVINTPLSQLSHLFPDLPSTVVGVSRAGKLFIPHSADQLFVGDLAYVVTTAEQVHRTMALFGHEEPEATRIVIAGGGNIGQYVARTIEQRQSRTKVKIIEASRERATAVADTLRHTVVLNGSALDQRLLQEADIQDTDLMVALTNHDQVNILSSVMAKRLGCKANLALINNPSFLDITKTMGIDATVDPGAVTVSRVLQHVRRGRIRAVHSLHRGGAEAIEAEALETSPLVGQALRDLDLPDGMRVGAVYRDGTVHRPSGSLRIKAKDRVVIFALERAVRQVEQMFRVSLDFF
jgi:trk system potassium uptake protein TrkA